MQLTKTPGPTLLADAIDTLIYCRDHLDEWQLDNPSGDWKSLEDAIYCLAEIHRQAHPPAKPVLLQH